MLKRMGPAWMAALLVTVSACNGHAAIDPGVSTGPAGMIPVPEAEMQRIRGEVIVGKDGYGLTLCGQDRQQIITFSATTQEQVDRYLAGGGALQFLVEGGAKLENGALQVVTIERIDDAETACR